MSTPYDVGIIAVVAACMIIAGINSKFTFQSVMMAGLAIAHPGALFMMSGSDPILSFQGVVVMVLYVGSLVAGYMRG